MPIQQYHVTYQKEGHKQASTLFLDALSVGQHTLGFFDNTPSETIIFRKLYLYRSGCELVINSVTNKLNQNTSACEQHDLEQKLKDYEVKLQALDKLQRSLPDKVALNRTYRLTEQERQSLVDSKQMGITIDQTMLNFIDLCQNKASEPICLAEMVRCNPNHTAQEVERAYDRVSEGQPSPF